ncbi:hypothetical protein SK128_022885, partial [Halocaridina rubra]
ISEVSCLEMVSGYPGAWHEVLHCQDSGTQGHLDTPPLLCHCRELAIISPDFPKPILADTHQQMS